MLPATRPSNGVIGGTGCIDPRSRLDVDDEGRLVPYETDEIKPLRSGTPHPMKRIPDARFAEVLAVLNQIVQLA